MSKNKGNVRKAITLSPILAEFVESESKKIGITQSGFIAIALSQYLRQQEAIEAIKTSQEVINFAKSIT